MVSYYLNANLMKILAFLQRQGYGLHVEYYKWEKWLDKLQTISALAAKFAEVLFMSVQACEVKAAMLNEWEGLSWRGEREGVVGSSDVDYRFRRSQSIDQLERRSIYWEKCSQWNDTRGRAAAVQLSFQDVVWECPLSAKIYASRAPTATGP